MYVALIKKKKEMLAFVSCNLYFYIVLRIIFFCIKFLNMLCVLLVKCTQWASDIIQYIRTRASESDKARESYRAY